MIVVLLFPIADAMGYMMSPLVGLKAAGCRKPRRGERM